MTQISLANLTTQIQPAGLGKATVNGTPRSAEPLQIDDQKNLPVNNDLQQSNISNDFDCNTLSANSEFKPKQDQPGNAQVSDRPVGSGVAGSDTQPATVNFEEIVANILAESGLCPEEPVVVPQADLEILPLEMKSGLTQVASVSGTNELGEAIEGIQVGLIKSEATGLAGLTEATELPAEAVNNLPVGQVAPVAGDIENLQATQASNPTELVNPDFQQAKPEAHEESVGINSEALAVGGVEVGPIKLEGLAEQSKSSEVAVPLGTKDLERTGLAEDFSETDSNTVNISQQAVKPQINPQATELKDSAVPVVETPKQTQTKTIVQLESGEKITAVQTKPLNIEAKTEIKAKTEPVQRLRAVGIASYREVQESVSTESRPATSLPTGDTLTKVQASADKSGQELKIGEELATDIATMENKAQVPVADSNFGSVTEMLQPGESAGIAPVSGVNSVAVENQARPVSTEMIEQITNHIQANRNNLYEQMTIRLDPPELGQIKIQVTNNQGEGLRGIVEVEHGRTLAELNREAPALIQKLNDAGIQVKSMEFRMNDQSDHRGDSTNDNAGNMFNNFGANSHGRGGQAHGEAQGEAASYSSRSQFGQDLNDLSAEVNDRYNYSGHYVSENSLNVMI